MTDLEQEGVSAVDFSVGSRLQAAVATVEHDLYRDRRPLMFFRKHICIIL